MYIKIVPTTRPKIILQDTNHLYDKYLSSSPSRFLPSPRPSSPSCRSDDQINPAATSPSSCGATLRVNLQNLSEKKTKFFLKFHKVSLWDTFGKFASNLQLKFEEILIQNCNNIVLVNIYERLREKVVIDVYVGCMTHLCNKIYKIINEASVNLKAAS